MALLTTLKRWETQIIIYYRYRVTNGYVEGSNNRTKVIQRQALGYRNGANLRRRILLPQSG